MNDAFCLQTTCQRGSQPPVLLAILDGFGMAEAGPGNAISRARTPTLDHLLRRIPGQRFKRAVRRLAYLMAR